ncbi:hypothetical protein MJ560_19560 [Klebsiella pneumoniae]|nr:hypothetical protein MJ560_19560 [Klebsiella pneumoniae]
MYNAKPVQNLKDVLRDVPGVQLTNEGDNRKGVSIRGPEQQLYPDPGRRQAR